MKRLALPLAASFGLAVAATFVWAGMGAEMRLNSQTGQSFPYQTRAGYLATADGGVVNVMNAPGPTAVGQVLGISELGTQPKATWQTVPSAPLATNARIPAAAGTALATSTNAMPADAQAARSTNARLSSTTVTTTASSTATDLVGSDAMCILPKATTTVWGVSEFDTTLPLAAGVPSVGSGGLELQSTHIHPTEGAARSVYYATGSGGVAPANLSQIPHVTADSFTFAATTSQTLVFSAVTVTGDPGLTVYPGGTYKARLWAYASASTLVKFNIYAGGSLRGTSATTTIPSGASFAEYDLFLTATSDVTSAASTQVGYNLYAWTSSGTSTLTIGIGGVNSTDVIAPWTPLAITSLASSAPPLVAAGPSTAGTGTSAQRSDSQQGLSASNPNKGDFFRSPVGTDTATSTSAGWDHATDIPRYAGSGAADPSQSPGVAGPVLSFYYQTANSTDAGVVFDLWWKSGGGDTAWTRLASGSGSGSPPALNLTSPLGTITIGSGGGFTTEDVVYGHAANTALQGSEWNAASGVCSLDPNTMVPLANLYASTETHAGTMSAADKIILDNMVSDTYEVTAAAGTTPGYLADVVESPDSSITWGTSGNYVTAAVNFGTGTSQVCSGSTCAGLQPALPVCYQGQELVNGTLTNTATGTNTTSDWTCRTSPWQPAGSYEPAQSGKPGQIEMFGTTTATGTATTTTTVKTAQNPPWTTSSGIGVSTVHNITTATSSSTMTALATAAIGDNAQVTIPPASTTAYGVAELGTNNTVGTTTNTGTASTTATDGKCMPAGATANGDHKTLAGSGAPNPDYLVNLLYSGDGSISINGYYPDLSHEVVNLLARAGTTAVKGIVQMDPNARIAAASGTASSTSTLVLAADAKAARATSRNIATTTATATASSTATDLLGSDAQVVLPVASTTQAGIVPISTTARIGNTTVTTTASSTATKCLGEDALAIIPASGVTGSGALNYYARWLNSSTLGTGNLTDYADASGSYCNGKFTASGNISAANISATPGVNTIAKGDGVGSLDSWITKHVTIFHSTTLATTLAIGDYPTWHTVLSFSTGGTAGQIVVQASFSAHCSYSTPVHGHLVIDAAQIAAQYVSSCIVPSGDSYGFATIALSGYATFVAGGHTVALQAYTDNTGCTIQGNDQITGGSAILVATEYTN